MRASHHHIAVLDVGSTNTKLIVFDQGLNCVFERSRPSVHRPGPPYGWIDPEPVIAFAKETLAEVYERFTIGTIVPCAHGSALALLDEGGALALPVMDYEAEPPDAVREAYRAFEPPFSEVFAPTNPGALTLGLQLFWQETKFPDAFQKVRTIVPWGQYIAYRLSGTLASEICALGAQTHLFDVSSNAFSSLAKSRGWAKLFAPIQSAWKQTGSSNGVDVLVGIHDSNANLLRYRASMEGAFTLLSTGTWLIGFAVGGDLASLDPARDTVSNTDIYGNPVCSCRFMAGREFEIVSGGAAADLASLETVQALIDEGVFATASFTDSGGPLPGTGGKGTINRDNLPAAERSSLAALYCALMAVESASIIHADGPIIVDGPLSTNDVFLSVFAQFVAGTPVLASSEPNGTAAGAALLALADEDGAIEAPTPQLSAIEPATLRGLGSYREEWLRRSEPI
ncbi:MAG: carbohydrate kinase [Pseudomonadota bacterium]